MFLGATTRFCDLLLPLLTRVSIVSFVVSEQFPRLDGALSWFNRISNYLAAKEVSGSLRGHRNSASSFSNLRTSFLTRPRDMISRFGYFLVSHSLSLP